MEIAEYISPYNTELNVEHKFQLFGVKTAWWKSHTIVHLSVELNVVVKNLKMIYTFMNVSCIMWKNKQQFLLWKYLMEIEVNKMRYSTKLWIIWIQEKRWRHDPCSRSDLLFFHLGMKYIYISVNHYRYHTKMGQSGYSPCILFF